MGDSRKRLGEMVIDAETVSKAERRRIAKRTIRRARWHIRNQVRRGERVIVIKIPNSFLSSENARRRALIGPPSSAMLAMSWLISQFPGYQITRFSRRVESVRYRAWSETVRIDTRTKNIELCGV